jgi:hypothetical protein
MAVESYEVVVESRECEVLVPIDCWCTTEEPPQRTLFTAPVGRYTVTLLPKQVHLRSTTSGAVYNLAIRAYTNAHERGDMKEVDT